MSLTTSRAEARPGSPAHSPHRGRAPAVATVLASAALALGLSGCAGSNASNASNASTASSDSGAAGAGGAAVGAGSYADSGAVISALKHSGQACTPVSASGGTSVTAPGLRSTSACSLGSAGGGTVTASVFDDHTDAEAYAELLTSAQDSGLLIGAGGSDSARAVLGGNWVVLVDGAAAASRLGSALDGTVVGGSSSNG
jgi:hypothetical protein